MAACSGIKEKPFSTETSISINFEVNGERFLIHPPAEYYYLDFEKRRSCCNDSKFEWTFRGDSISRVSIYFHPDTARIGYKQAIEKNIRTTGKIKFLNSDSTAYRGESERFWGDTVYHNQFSVYSSERAYWRVTIWCKKCDELDKQFVELIDSD
jgi:hypothetical protein